MSTKISPYLKGNVLEATIVEEKPKSYVVKTPDGKICSIPKFRSMSNWKEIDFKNTKTPQKFVLSDWVVKGYFECVREGEKFSFQTGTKPTVKAVVKKKAGEHGQVTSKAKDMMAILDDAYAEGKKLYDVEFEKIMEEDEPTGGMITMLSGDCGGSGFVYVTGIDGRSSLSRHLSVWASKKGRDVRFDKSLYIYWRADPALVKKKKGGAALDAQCTEPKRKAYEKFKDVLKKNGVKVDSLLVKVHID